MKKRIVTIGTYLAAWPFVPDICMLQTEDGLCTSIIRFMEFIFSDCHISSSTPQYLPHEYPPQPASQLCSADTQDQIENP